MEKASELELIGNVSTAALQGLFLYNKGNVERAISMAGSLAKNAIPEHQKQTATA
jgi:chaperone BCS1